MKIDRTERGFEIVTFIDRYDKECSLQKSSLATEDCIWFGQGKERMHLTQKMVIDLLPLLYNFIKTGELSD